MFWGRKRDRDSVIDQEAWDEAERIETEIERCLPVKDGFQKLCEEVGLDNICDPPTYGVYGRDWGHYDLDDLDNIIVRRGFKSLTFRVCCSEYPRYADKLGSIGMPTFEVPTISNGLILMEARYNRKTHEIEVRLTSLYTKPENLKTEAKWMSVKHFLAYHPKLIGISYYSQEFNKFLFYDMDIHLPDKARLAEGYRPSLRQRIRRFFFGR